MISVHRSTSLYYKSTLYYTDVDLCKLVISRLLNEMDNVYAKELSSAQ